MSIRPFGVVLLAGVAVAGGAVTTFIAQNNPPAAGWKHASYVKAAAPGGEDLFGYAVALSSDGSTMAVGAHTENGAVKAGDRTDAAYASGAVYVLVRGPKGWTEQARLKASNLDANDQFGSQVALSRDGNTLAVAAHFEDSAATGVNGNQSDNSMADSGAVYVFTRSGTTWTQQAYIKASNTGEAEDGDTFGYSLALSGDGNTLAAGSPERRQRDWRHQRRPDK